MDAEGESRLGRMGEVAMGYGGFDDFPTTVSINFDETVSTIEVEGVMYYPDDSFILDGKKVTVVEY